MIGLDAKRGGGIIGAGIAKEQDAHKESQP